MQVRYEFQIGNYDYDSKELSWENDAIFMSNDIEIGLDMVEEYVMGNVLNNKGIAMDSDARLTTIYIDNIDYASDVSNITKYDGYFVYRVLEVESNDDWETQKISRVGIVNGDYDVTWGNFL